MGLLTGLDLAPRVGLKGSDMVVTGVVSVNGPLMDEWDWRGALSVTVDACDSAGTVLASAVASAVPGNVDALQFSLTIAADHHGQVVVTARQTNGLSWSGGTIAAETVQRRSAAGWKA